MKLIKLNFWWDACNKWLYFGTKEGQANQFILLLNNYFWFPLRKLNIREWTLFQIMWDNGAWCLNDLYFEPTTIISIPKMKDRYIENTEYTKQTGNINGFVQIMLLGVGLRYKYKKLITVVLEKPTEDNVKEIVNAINEDSNLTP